MGKADKLDLKQLTRRPFKSRDLANSREVNRQGQRNRAMYIFIAMFLNIVQLLLLFLLPCYRIKRSNTFPPRDWELLQRSIRVVNFGFRLRFSV